MGTPAELPASPSSPTSPSSDLSLKRPRRNRTCTSPNGEVCESGHEETREAAIAPDAAPKALADVAEVASFLQQRRMRMIGGTSPKAALNSYSFLPPQVEPPAGESAQPPSSIYSSVAVDI